MRTFVLLLLLLLGCLQAAIAPAVSPDVPDGRHRFRASPFDSPPAPVDNSTSVKRMTEAPRQSVLPGDGKFSRIVLAGALVPAPAGAPASSRTSIAGLADAESIQLQPRKPRAPPPAPPF